METPSNFRPATANMTLPDHTQLPESDGSFVENFQELPQSMLLTDSIRPLLRQRHPDGQFAIGQDSGIYWNLEAALSDNPVQGAIAPDWCYIPNVPKLLNGAIRRSYVMWQEQIPPLIAIEFVLDNGAEVRDTTPGSGRFWIYEQGIGIQFYAIYEVELAAVEVYALVNGRYTLVSANEHGHYPIPPLGVGLGIWQGKYFGMELPWLRWWDAAGNLLLTSEERAEQFRQQREQFEREKEQEQQRAERLAAQLRALGIDPDV